MNMLKNKEQKENEPKNNYVVYVHINKTNGKKYVGITKQNPERRWQNGCGYKYHQNTYFWNAICKYSWNGFEHKILESNLSFEEAKNMERYYIAKYKSYIAEYGYNLTLGGDGFQGMNRSKETKEKISKSLKGKYAGTNSPNFGRHPSKETIMKQITTKKKNQNYHTDEWKKQHSEQMRGSNNVSSKAVRCITTGEIFCNAREATEYYNADKSRIHKCCKGIERSSGKHPITGEKLCWEYL